VPTAPGGDTSIEAIRAHLRSQADGLAQTLSLEVVSLMVDNIAHDERLLVPVQQLIRRMEPALLLLALADPRLFTNKLHPARVLVQEVANHSLAYASVEATGCAEFVDGVARAIAPLEHDAIEDAEPFEKVLHQLQGEWKQAERASARSREEAMQALQQAEQRNLLAEKIAREVASHPDAARVPAVVMDFLCGPWAQVVAQARIGGATAEGAADKYQALSSALLWSTDPELTRKNIAKLTRLVPLLLGNLREGLETIRYPATRTSVFLEALMGCTGRPFVPPNRRPGPSQPEPEPPVPTRESGGRWQPLGGPARGAGIQFHRTSGFTGRSACLATCCCCWRAGLEQLAAGLLGGTAGAGSMGSYATHLGQPARHPVPVHQCPGRHPVHDTALR
jgi:hypothetical protein